MSNESFDAWYGRQIMEYNRQRAEEDALLEELNGDWSLENIRKLYEKKYGVKNETNN